MIEFHEPVISDKQWVKDRLSNRDNLTCEYTFANIFSYCAKMKIEIADVGGFLVSRCRIDDMNGYCYPVGNGDIRYVLSLVIEDMRSSGEKCFFFGVGEKEKAELEMFFPGTFDILYDRDGCDYIYKSTDLINLSGKKYQPKRNHISFLKKKLQLVL